MKCVCLLITVIFPLEPGYYENNEFGVRIENVELVKSVASKYRFNDLDYLSMEPVTLVNFVL